MVRLSFKNFTGLSYTGSTHALGACRLGSIPSSPTNSDIFQIEAEATLNLIIDTVKKIADALGVGIDDLMK